MINLLMPPLLRSTVGIDTCVGGQDIGRYTLSNHYVPVPNVTKIRIKLLTLVESRKDLQHLLRVAITRRFSSTCKDIPVNFTVSYPFLPLIRVSRKYFIYSD